MSTVHSSAHDIEKGAVQHRGNASDSEINRVASNTGYKGEHVSRELTAGGHAIDTSQPAFPVYHRKFGNPSPMGLLSFALSLFVLAMYISKVRDINQPNVIIGLALGLGTLNHLIVSVEEWVCGNTFGATVFALYGGFWFSFACLYIPQLGILAAFGDNVDELNAALGIYLIAWGCLTFFFLLAALKSSIALCGVLFFLDLTLWVLSAAYLAPSAKATLAGGILGVITSVIAAYTGVAGLLTPDTSYFQLPVGSLARAD